VCASYRTIGVAEIVFIDQRKRRVRILRKRGDGYEENEITTGAVRFETLPGFQVDVDWLFDEPRPAARGLLDRLLTGEGT
jgi:Uma2 family endonuclease